MNKTSKYTRSLLSLILCTVLIAALALCTAGCKDNGQTESPETPTGTAEETVTASDEAGTQASEIIVKGEGATVFYFEVVDGQGNTTKFEIHTDAETVGDALLELGLIEGEEAQYGLYVKTVNGITADYDVDGTYWAFYEDGEYGMTGVDLTKVRAGATYAFKVSK